MKHIHAILFFHSADTLVPVTTVQLGEPVTFTCPLPEDKDISGKLYWYKQNAGDSMKLIALLWIHAKPENGPASSASRLIVTIDEKISNLTILRTVQGDEGMYHCAFNDWKNHSWHGNYLSLKGSVSLQCSVLSDSDNKTCSGGLRVFWFRSRSDKSYPDIIYADGNRHDECEKKPDSQKRCVFSKNISSSDAGTYYCAVATCGQILFGKGIKIEAGMILCLLFGNILSVLFTNNIKVPLLYFQYLNISQQIYVTIMSLLLSAQNEDGQDLNYVALHFSGGKSSRGKKKKELKTEESVYSHVKI
uniref:Ig-like domain-containing protein n=1 Tax=Kryptolebias marmoratus TaxID=37003 RepID=A0A3Q3BK31_KRYMA